MLAAITGHNATAQVSAQSPHGEVVLAKRFNGAADRRQGSGESKPSAEATRERVESRLGDGGVGDNAISDVGRAKVGRARSHPEEVERRSARADQGGTEVSHRGTTR